MSRTQFFFFFLSSLVFFGVYFLFGWAFFSSFLAFVQRSVDGRKKRYQASGIFQYKPLKKRHFFQMTIQPLDFFFFLDDSFKLPKIRVRKRCWVNTCLNQYDSMSVLLFLYESWNVTTKNRRVYRLFIAIVILIKSSGHFRRICTLQSFEIEYFRLNEEIIS